MTSQLFCFRCFYLLLAAEEKTLQNGAAVMSLRSFLFRNNFSDLFKVYGIRFDMINYYGSNKSTRKKSGKSAFLCSVLN